MDPPLGKNQPQSKLSEAAEPPKETMVGQDSQPAGNVPVKPQPAGKDIKKTKKKAGLFLSVAILGLVDLLCLFVFAFLLANLPAKAQQASILKTQNYHLAALGNLSDIEIQLNLAQQKTDQLKALYPDENQLLKFVNQIDRFKERRIVTHFSFASNNKEKDKLGYLEVPIVIEFRGSWPQISQALEQIEQLPFLLRAIDVSAEQLSGQEMKLRYGGVLYVK